MNTEAEMVSHHTDIGKSGVVFGVVRNTHNPRELLQELYEADPGAENADLLAAFSQAILEDRNRDFLLGVIEYFVTNMVRFCREERAAGATIEEKVAAKRKASEARKLITAATKEELFANAKSLVLMDLLLPHGKTLADSTGGECAMLAGRMGKWLSRVAEAVPEGKLVGKTLTEARVRALYASV